MRLVKIGRVQTTLYVGTYTDFCQYLSHFLIDLVEIRYMGVCT